MEQKEKRIQLPPFTRQDNEEGQNGKPGGIVLSSVGLVMNNDINIQASEIKVQMPSISYSNMNDIDKLKAFGEIDINVKFGVSSSILDEHCSSDVLNSLLKTLVDYRNILLSIQGNVSNTANPTMNRNTMISINNGQSTVTVGRLQSLRAEAIIQFLVKKGIEPNRLSVGIENIGPNTASATGKSN